MTIAKPVLFNDQFKIEFPEEIPEAFLRRWTEKNFWDQVEIEKLEKCLTKEGKKLYDALISSKFIGEDAFFADRAYFGESFCLNSPEYMVEKNKDVSVVKRYRSEGRSESEITPPIRITAVGESLSRDLSLKHFFDPHCKLFFYQEAAEGDYADSVELLILSDKKSWVARITLNFGGYSDEDYDGSGRVELVLCEGLALERVIDQFIKSGLNKIVSKMTGALDQLEAQDEQFKSLLDRLVDHPKLSHHFKAKMLELALSSGSQSAPERPRL